MNREFNTIGLYSRKLFAYEQQHEPSMSEAMTVWRNIMQTDTLLIGKDTSLQPGDRIRWHKKNNTIEILRGKQTIGFPGLTLGKPDYRMLLAGFDVYQIVDFMAVLGEVLYMEVHEVQPLNVDPSLYKEWEFRAVEQA